MKKEPIKGILKHKSHKNPKIDQLAVMDGDTISYLTQKLPPNFFESIVMTEMELSEEFNHDKLRSLFQLYSQAIQYYSYVDQTKLKPYQNRMEYYLTKRETLNNLTKFNIETKKTKLGMHHKSDAHLRRVKTYSLGKGNAKTLFKYKSKDINENEIRKQVREVLKDVVILMKIDKKNLRNIINEEMIKQRVQFIENLNEKRGLDNYWKNKRRTICTKNRGGSKKEFRKTLYIKGKGKIGKNGFFKRRTMNLKDDDPLEFDKTNEKDYLKLLNEIDGEKDGKSNLDDSSIINDSFEEEEGEDSFSSSDSDSSSDDDDEENEEHSEKIKNHFNKLDDDDSSLNKSKDLLLNNKNKFNILNKIDESVEYEKNNIENKNKNNNKKEFNYVKNILDQKIENKEQKNLSSRNIRKLSLPPIENEKEKEKEKQILPIEPKEKEKEKNEIKEEKKEKEKENINEKNGNNEKPKEKNEINKNEINDDKDEYKFLMKKDMVKEIMDEIEREEKPVQRRRKSIETEDVMRKIELDIEIKTPINEKLERIENINEIIHNGEDSNFASTRSLPAISKKITIEKIAPEYRKTFLKVDEKMSNYVDVLNKYYYTEMFDNFYMKLTEIYKQKYEKYIKVNDEYFSNIKENEFLLEYNDKMGENEKKEIQNIIDSLKEEQKDQIDKVLDEFNTNISNLISDYKQNLFKKNVGVQLIEEQLKLDIYSMINDAFY